MKNLIPHFIHQQLELQNLGGSFKAATLFVDISGFTALTETLMKYEKDGAEVLTDVLNRVFNPLVQAVYGHGGFISTFAGDAFTALFPTRNKQAAARTAQAAFFIQQFFAQHGVAQTKYGDFTLSVKVGLGLGQVQWGILGRAEWRTYFFRGPAIDDCADAQHCAEGGDIIAVADLLPWLGECVQAESFGAHYRLLKPSFDLPPKKSRLPALTPQALRPFVLDEVINLRAPAEFRDVACVFISLDEHATLPLLDSFVSEVLAEALNYGGYFNKLDFGDKGPVMLVLFGAPVAHENNLARAADFLLALQGRPLGVQWRAGLAYGTVYAGIMGGAERCEYTAIGNVVNLASRLMTQAAWGQLLVSGAVAASHALKTEYSGDFQFKGFANAQPTYQLLGRRSGEETLFEQPLVGREVELQQLVAAAQPLFEGRLAGVAYVYGEPGIGKSHLAYELRQALERQGAIRWFTGQADQILQQAFNPFTYFLKRYFNQLPEATPDENRAGFERRLSQLIESLERLVPAPDRPNPSPGTGLPPTPGGLDIESLKSELLRTKSILGALVGLYWPGSLYESLDGNLRYQNTLFAIKTLLLAESRLRPVVLELEDLQWLDEASHEALATLSRNIADYPLLIVVTSRYADDGGRPTLKLADETPTVVIDLNVLSPDNLRRLAEEILGGPISDELLNLLIERTQANPFFSQQFLYYFRGDNLLETRAVGKAGPVWTVKETIPADVPTTINAILIARVDRLAQNVKDVVKAAAVLGREFDDRILARMLQADVSEQVRVAEQEQIWSEIG